MAPNLGPTQGLFAATIVDATPAELRGTAFGVFNFVSGIAMLLASVVAGVLWDRYGAGVTFLAGRPLPASHWSAWHFGAVHGGGRMRREGGGSSRHL